MPTFFKRGLAVFGALTILGLAAFTSLRLGSSGTVITQFVHVTSTVNPSSIAAYDSTSTRFAIPNLDSDDSVWLGRRPPEWTFSTSTIDLRVTYATSGYADLWYKNTSGTALDLPSGVPGINSLKH